MQLLDRRQVLQVRPCFGHGQENHRTDVAPFNQGGKGAYAGQQVHVGVEDHHVGQAAGLDPLQRAAAPLWLACGW